jgi:hypothetical protein
MTTPSDIDPLRLLDHPVGAGAAGALVGLRFVPGATWIERFINVFSGAACATYVGPAAAELLQLTSHGAIMGLGFGLGAFGVTLADVLVQTLRELPLAQIVTGLFSRSKG